MRMTVRRIRRTCRSPPRSRSTTFDAENSSEGWVEVDGPAQKYTLDIGDLAADGSNDGSVVFAVTVADSLPDGVEELTNVVSIAGDFADGATASDTTPVEALAPVLWTTNEAGEPWYDFHPDTVVYIHGSGFEPNKKYDIPVIRPDGTILKGSRAHRPSYPNGPSKPEWDSIRADDDGNFVYEYDLDGILGLYDVYVYESKWGGPGSDDVAVATVVFADAPLYEITKSLLDINDDTGDTEIDAAGDVVAYQVTVVDTGDQSITNVALSDELVADVVGTPVETGGTGINGDGTLDVGETWTYTYDYTVLQSDIDSVATNEPDDVAEGLLDNTASVTSTEILTPQSDSEQVPLASVPLGNRMGSHNVLEPATSTLPLSPNYVPGLANGYTEGETAAFPRGIESAIGRFSDHDLRVQHLSRPLGWLTVRVHESPDGNRPGGLGHDIFGRLAAGDQHVRLGWGLRFECLHRQCHLRRAQHRTVCHRERGQAGVDARGDV